VQYSYFDSPVGPLLIAGDASAVNFIRFPENGAPEPPQPGWTEAVPRGALAVAAAQLREYFARQRRQFDLPLAPAGTLFQQSVWRALEDIPYGDTISYVELARRVGKPNASRAVGQANGRNPIPIVIPCHRVIAADGSLGGFGGGLLTKITLLRLEGRLL
jgi:methylated-DNA-[protein]-cysteine S-methyltransferase